ncbi:MAG: 30S ribosome-binding factor RbfA [Steroidobacteraceae bacterium]
MKNAQRDFPRARRIEGELQRRLAELLRREVKDPRVALVTVTAVQVSQDLSHAQVYYGVLGREPTREVQEGLDHVAGFLRAKLGRLLKMRQVPEIHFKPDEMIARAAHLTSLIDQAVAADRKREP